MSADGGPAAWDDAGKRDADGGVGSYAFFYCGLEVGECEGFLVLDWMGDEA
jgi:hypothetical protein